MRVLFSHSSRQKALVKRILDRLPRTIDVWLDEFDLRSGASLSVSIRQAIEEGTDYFVVFLSPEAAQSEWVAREIGWALDKERVEARTLILPVVLIDAKETWDGETTSQLKDRLYLRLFSQEDAQIQVLSQQIGDALLRLVDDDLARMRGKNPPVSSALRASIWRKRSEISASDWQHLFRSAKHRIWLLGHTMRRSVAWDETGPILRDQVALGIDVRLVILDPTDSSRQISEIARRLREPNFTAKIEETLRLAWEVEDEALHLPAVAARTDLRAGSKPYLSIGVTQDTIHNSIVIVDDRVWVTVYSHQNEMGDEGTTLDLSADEPAERSLCEFFEREFLLHWRRSRVYFDKVRHPVRLELRATGQQERIETSNDWYEGALETLKPPHLAVIFPTYRCKYGPRSRVVSPGEHLPIGPGEKRLLCANCMFEPILNGNSKDIEMEPARLGELVEDLANSGVRLVELSGGGEPFHHTRFPAILDALAAAHARAAGRIEVGLIANVAALLQCDFKEKVLSSLSYIRWSWPEDAELQPSIRGQYLQAITDLIAMRENLGLKVVIGAKVLATRANCASPTPAIVPLVDELMRSGLDHVKVRTMRSFASSPDVDDLRRIADRLLRVEIALDQEGFLPPGRTLEVDLQERYVESDYRCRLSTLMAVIEPKGDLRMCWNDTKAGKARVFGNVFESGFMAAWGTARHREVCRSMKANDVCNDRFGCHCRVVGYQQAADRLFGRGGQTAAITASPRDRYL